MQAMGKGNFLLLRMGLKIRSTFAKQNDTF